MSEARPPQCYFCCRFIYYRDRRKAVRWTPYGDASMEEPPPEEYAHLRCWKGVTRERRKLIESVAWAKPYSPASKERVE